VLFEVRIAQRRQRGHKSANECVKSLLELCYTFCRLPNS
jgi:hypothetical protein